MHYREGCHLCEDMQQQLAELFEPGEFRLTLIDIDEDAVLREAYNVRVPVLSLVQLPASRLPEEGLEVATAGLAQGAKPVRNDAKGPLNGTLKELCEHFLDLVAVREALASYNRPLLAARTSPADR